MQIVTDGVGGAERAPHDPAEEQFAGGNSTALWHVQPVQLATFPTNRTHMAEPVKKSGLLRLLHPLASHLHWERGGHELLAML
jgi:hypothetical protein